MRPAGLVCGLRLEATLARRAGIAPALIVVAGPGAPDAAGAVRRLAAAGAGGIVSFGLCGGLDPALLPGTVVVAAAVGWLPEGDGGAGMTASDGDWQAALRERLAGVVPVAPGGLAWSARPVLSAEAKRALRLTLNRRLGGDFVAVDMESGPLAAAAAAAGLPFATLRAVADPATRAVPAALAAAALPDGAITPWPILTGLARGAVGLGELLSLQRETRAAQASLRRAGAAVAAP